MAIKKIGRACFLLSLALPLVISGSQRNTVTLALEDKIVKDLSSSGLTLAFHIGAANSSRNEKLLVSYRYRVFVNQREYLDMEVPLDQPLTVPAGEKLLIALPVKITYALLFQEVGVLEDRAQCDIVGEMFFGDGGRREERVSFAFSGEFPIFHDPEVEFLPLQVKTLTVGGADVAFRPKFSNRNNFDLLINRISFRLFLGDKDVLSGEIPGDKTIPGSGEKVFALPVLIDFFEEGPEIRSMFETGRLPSRIVGDLEIASVWGKLLIPFDEQQDITIDRQP